MPILTFNVWFKPTQLGLKGKTALGGEGENSFAYQAEPGGSLGEPMLSVNVLFHFFFSLFHRAF